MRLERSVSIFLVSICLAFRNFLAAADDCFPPCNFTLANETSTCRVYGVVGSSVVPFYRANESCLETYNISYTRLDLEDLLVVCPDAMGNNPDVTALTNILRLGGNSESNFLKQQFPQYFELNNSTGNYELKSSVLDRHGAPVDCQSTPGLCWDVLKIYFGALSEGKAKVIELCGLLHKRFTAQSMREQSDVRRLLCGLGSSPACEPLFDQVKQYASNNTCDALAVPADQSQVPSGCDSSNGGNGNAGNSGSRRIGVSVLAAMLGVALATTFNQHV